MNSSTDWISALAILAAGLILGVLFVVLFNKRKRTLGGDPDLDRKDLEAKRDALIAQLRDPALDAEERARIEADAANVLRQLDERGAAAAAGTPVAATPSAAMNPTTKGFLWGAGSCAALAALFYFVMQQAAPRQEGGSLTGDIGQPQQTQMQPGQQPPDPALQQLVAAVQGDPDNLPLRNQLAQAYLERDNMMAVFEQTNYVLQKSPNDSRALTFQGLVRLAMGETEQALQMLQRATKSDPKNLDSWVALAWVHAQNGNLPEAEKMIAEAAKHSPADKPRLDEVFAQMKQHIAQAGTQPAQTASAGDLPAGHPPVDATAPPAAPSAGGGVRVTLDLAPAAQPRSGIVFVIARNPGGGPPVAVKRIAASAFPVSVDLTAADSMMGQPLPARFRLEARLDTDGDPMTRPTTDPSASQENVTVGAVVQLSLK